VGGTREVAVEVPRGATSRKIGVVPSTDRAAGRVSRSRKPVTVVGAFISTTMSSAVTATRGPGCGPAL
jgi:hypothetical protein